MALTCADLVLHMQHATGAPNPYFAPVDLVNQAGEWLLGCHEWKFLERPPGRLNLRGQIAITAATWTESTKTLAVTQPPTALANYVRLPGDSFRVTGGTGAKSGYYNVAASTTTSLTLETSIGAAADTQTDIIGTMALPSIILPSGIQEVIAIQADGLTNKQVQMTDFQSLVNFKASGLTGSSWGYWAAVDWGDYYSPGGGAPTPRLEIYPDPGQDSIAVLTMFYRASWKALNDDADRSNTPTWFDPLLIQAVRAYGLGIEKSNMEQQQGLLRTSVLFLDTCRRDGSIQRKYGKVRGSAVRRTPWPPDPHFTSLQISRPS